jgi:hypothetical protein
MNELEKQVWVVILHIKGVLMAEVLRFIEGSQKIYGKWFKILHS